MDALNNMSLVQPNSTLAPTSASRFEGQTTPHRRQLLGDAVIARGFRMDHSGIKLVERNARTGTSTEYQVVSVLGILKGPAKDGVATLIEKGRYVLDNGREIEMSEMELNHLFESACLSTDGELLCEMGTYYALGTIGPKQDLVRARGLYEQAAAKGIPEALFNLAVLSEDGKESMERTWYLYNQAAFQGVAKAWYRMGLIYERGIGGVLPNQEEARKLYEIAAAQGVVEAKNKLVGMCARGEGGVQKDLANARQPYAQAPVQNGFEVQDAWAASCENADTQTT